MPYSDRAKERRRCRAMRQDGAPCTSYAVWADAQGRCSSHGGRTPGHVSARHLQHAPSYPTAYQPCRCVAYAWPHRPSGGLCRWPDPPSAASPIPAGTGVARSLPGGYRARTIDDIQRQLTQTAGAGWTVRTAQPPEGE